jgi:ubiquinone/menaquinone biosynthesis C-methylase UbiE
MPDVYLTIAQAPEELQHQLADVLELRAADAQQRAMLEAYLGELGIEGARVLEIGCGTGAICRRLAQDAESVTGIDPSPVFIERARALAPGIRFEVGGGEALPFADDSFDVAIFHTVLCHIPDPATVLREARRVAPRLGAFDGDYATVTVAIADHDPLQACAEATVAGLVHDRWLVRKLPTLLEATGWTITRQASHAYTETAQPSYALTLVDRGSVLLAAAGTIGEDTADALRAEARRRVAAGTFYGHINYASFLASASV